jgi:hypothetical protein
VTAFPGVARALVERRAELLDRWIDAFPSSWLRVPRPVDASQLRGMGEGVLEALGAGLGEPGAGPGHGALREAEKRVAFAGGSFGPASASAFDIAALMLSLRDVLATEATGPDERAQLARLFDWLVALALEGYVTSREEGQRMRHRDALDRGTPVVMMTPDLPVALLGAEPDRMVAEGAFGRLLLAVVRTGARAVVVDTSGLVKPGALDVLDAFGTFARHRKVATTVQIVVSGLPPELEPVWRDAAGGAARVIVHERFEDAIAAAMAIAGMKIVRT